MPTIRKVLEKRKGITEEEIERLIQDAIDDFNNCIDEGKFDEALNICQKHFGLSDHYLYQLFFN